jgi:hypothetical protein
VDGEGYGIQVTLEIKAGLLDEAFILGIARDGKERLALGCFPDPAEIGVEKGVRAGQKTRGLRRSALTQLNRKRKRGGHDHDRESNGVRASNSHEMRWLES